MINADPLGIPSKSVLIQEDCSNFHKQTQARRDVRIKKDAPTLLGGGIQLRRLSIVSLLRQVQ
jgi:hypothetical protein